MTSYATDLVWGLDLLGFYGFYVITTVMGAHIVTISRKTVACGIHGVWTLLGFCAGIPLSDAVNHALKPWIRDPRPEGGRPMILRPGWPMAGPDGTDASLYTGVQVYGYPSGHAQRVFYALAFFYCLLRSAASRDAWQRRWRVWGGWFLFCGLVACMTLYQRWKYRRHTVEQLFGGAVLGTVMGGLTFVVTQALWVRLFAPLRALTSGECE